MQQQPQPPQLLFTFAFYIGSAAFAVVLGASMFAGTGADAAVLRGVQAFLAFLFVGWVAETIVQAAPAPRAKAEASGAAEAASAQPVAAAPVAAAPVATTDEDADDEAGVEPTMTEATEEAAEVDDMLAAVADLPTAAELMADNPLSILRDDDDTGDADGDEAETEDSDDQAERAA